MQQQVKGIRTLGGLFVIVGALGALLLPLFWKQLTSGQYTAVYGTPEYRLMVDFLPFALLMTALLVVMGFGFLSLKAWGRVCGFLYIGVSAVIWTLYTSRYTAVFAGSSDVRFIWCVWGTTIVAMAVLAYYLTRPEVKSVFHSK